MLLEIFVNYDCEISQKDISERIIDSLSKIANGRFNKSEHSQMISPQDEYSLRSYATHILVQMLRSFNGTIDASIAETKISERMQSNKPQRTEDLSDSNSEIEESKKKNVIGDI
jgi:hypothetical protein